MTAYTVEGWDFKGNHETIDCEDIEEVIDIVGKYKKAHIRPKKEG